MGTFERGVRPFDILAVVAVDEGVVGVFTNQFNEGIEFSFWELFLVFDDKEVLIAEEGALGEVRFGNIEIVLIVIKVENRCPLDLREFVGVAVDEKMALAEECHGTRSAVVLEMAV
jgi:hypothetical protein